MEYDYNEEYGLFDEIGKKLFGENFNINKISKEQRDKINKKILERKNKRIKDIGEKIFGKNFNINKISNEQMNLINSKILEEETINKIKKDIEEMKINNKNLKEEEEEEVRKDMFVCYLDNKKYLYPSTILWNRSRQFLIKEIGQKNFYNLKKTEKIEKILTFIFNNCEFKKKINEQYNNIIKKFDKNKHKWIETMKLSIEYGGRAVLVGRTRKTATKENIMKFIINYDPWTGDYTKKMLKLTDKELSQLAFNLQNNFIINYDDNGNPIDVKIVDLEDEMNNLNTILDNLNIDNDNEIDNIVNKLVNYKNVKAILNKQQIEGLINLISSKNNYGEKYQILKQLRILKKQKDKEKHEENIFKTDKKYKSSNKLKRKEMISEFRKNINLNDIKDDTKIKELGETDVDFDPKLVAILTEYWNPYLTPTKKKRFKKTERIFKLVKKGTYVYVLPEFITINGKGYYYTRRFFDFNDYLKSYQLSIIRHLNEEEKKFKIKEKIISILINRIKKIRYEKRDKNIKTINLNPRLKRYEKSIKKQIDEEKNKIEKIKSLINILKSRVKKINDYFIDLKNKKGDCDEKLLIKLNQFINDKKVKKIIKNNKNNYK